MVERVINFFKRCILLERSPKRLAFAFCLGNYIAFSPFLGLHTIMVFICAWVFRLNLTMMLAVSMGINNIWTLVPIYMADYVFGYWFCNKVLHLNFSSLNHWLNTVFLPIIEYIPSFIMIRLIDAVDYLYYFFEYKLCLAKPCVWSFLIGGNLLGIGISVILYPIMKKLFTRLSYQIHGISE